MKKNALNVVTLELFMVKIDAILVILASRRTNNFPKSSIIFVLSNFRDGNLKYELNKANSFLISGSSTNEKGKFAEASYTSEGAGVAPAPLAGVGWRAPCVEALAGGGHSGATAYRLRLLFSRLDVDCARH